MSLCHSYLTLQDTSFIATTSSHLAANMLFRRSDVVYVSNRSSYSNRFEKLVRLASRILGAGYIDPRPELMCIRISCPIKKIGSFRNLNEKTVDILPGDHVRDLSFSPSYSSRSD